MTIPLESLLTRLQSTLETCAANQEIQTAAARPMQYLQRGTMTNMPRLAGSTGARMTRTARKARITLQQEKHVQENAVVINAMIPTMMR